MGLVGSLWNPELQVRLQRIHRHIAGQAASGGPSAKRPPPQFQRRRPGTIRDAILAVLVEHRCGLRVRDVAVAVTAQLDGPIKIASLSPAFWREAQSSSGRFEQIGRGRYRVGYCGQTRNAMPRS
jgi:hypothetical protein